MLETTQDANYTTGGLLKTTQEANYSTRDAANHFRC